MYIRTTNSARTALTVRTLLSVRLERDPVEALTPADNEEEVIIFTNIHP